MELAQIRYFVVLCEERNFSRAAKRCGVSQPSLSNGIAKLEHELGGKLFERKGMSLTTLGKSLRPQFEITVASVARAMKIAMAWQRRQSPERARVARRSSQVNGAAAPVEADRLVSEL